MKLINFFNYLKNQTLTSAPYNFKVDVVYTYVDSKDPDFIKNLEYWKEEFTNLPGLSCTKNRFENYDELKYSIRSLRKFAPWINNIYIFTSSKKPNWPELKSKKIHFIKHEDIIPKKYLPLFNSFVIEFYLSLIPNLSEHFIYFNDDCFLGNFVEKSDFFTPDGKCKFAFDENIKNMKRNPQDAWNFAVFNSFDIIREKFGREADFLIHQAHPFLKSACHDCVIYFRKETEVLLKNKFRDFNDLIFNNIIYSFYIIYKNKGVKDNCLKENQKFASIVDDFQINQKNFEYIFKKRPKLFCLNNGTNFAEDKIKKQTVSFLEEYFPKKSKFEFTINMQKKMKITIEQKRNSNNLVWKFLVLVKDIGWAFSEFFKNKNIKKIDKTLTSVFENIYQKNIWGVRGGFGSGPGSLPKNTITYREFLQNFIKKNNIKSVLDAGSGDWQFSKLINWSGINYIGIDIVPALTEENTKKYSQKNIKFYTKNLVKDDLPKADLIILKDVLQHLSYQKIFKFLPKLKKYKFALLINDFGHNNTDCKDGDFRTLNLKKYPFNLDGQEVFFFENKQIFLIRN
jgi:hypothetical protein